MACFDEFTAPFAISLGHLLFVCYQISWVLFSEETPLEMRWLFNSDFYTDFFACLTRVNWFVRLSMLLNISFVCDDFVYVSLFMLGDSEEEE